MISPVRWCLFLWQVLILCGAAGENKTKRAEGGGGSLGRINVYFVHGRNFEYVLGLGNGAGGGEGGGRGWGGIKLIATTERLAG